MFTKKVLLWQLNGGPPCKNSRARASFFWKMCCGSSSVIVCCVNWGLALNYLDCRGVYCWQTMIFLLVGAVGLLGRFRPSWTIKNLFGVSRWGNTTLYCCWFLNMDIRFFDFRMMDLQLFCFLGSVASFFVDFRINDFISFVFRIWTKSIEQFLETGNTFIPQTEFSPNKL